VPAGGVGLLGAAPPLPLEQVGDVALRPASGSTGNSSPPISGSHAVSAASRCARTDSGSSPSTTSQLSTAWSCRGVGGASTGHCSPGSGVVGSGGSAEVMPHRHRRQACHRKERLGLWTDGRGCAPWSGSRTVPATLARESCHSREALAGITTVDRVVGHPPLPTTRAALPSGGQSLAHGLNGLARWGCGSTAARAAHRSARAGNRPAGCHSTGLHRTYVSKRTPPARCGRP
jgi:hypothetical protein